MKKFTQWIAEKIRKGTESPEHEVQTTTTAPAEQPAEPKPEEPKKEIKKGKSKIDFPEDYCIIDVETTGRSAEFDSIIEASAIRIRGQKVVDSFSSLVKPSRKIPKQIEAMTGITNEMTTTAPEQKDVLPALLDFIGSDVIVGHNVNYDLRFLSAAAGKEAFDCVANDYIDTLRIARKLFPTLEHHRLSDIAETCSVPYEGAHRSLNDCNITFSCFEKMREISLEQFGSAQAFKKSFGSGSDAPKRKWENWEKVDVSQITAKTDEFNEEHPFFQKTVVFTGTLSELTRAEAMQLVVDAGGLVADNVTKKTNYLVVGSFEFNQSVQGNKSGKIKKAEQMIADGLAVKIISETEFKGIMRK